jgi:hypothetical protein
MKNLIAAIVFILFSVSAYSQTCLSVDSVYSTAKFKDLGKRDIRFGIKQMTEDMLSEKYCISESGVPVHVEVFFFGLPKTTIRIVGVEKTNQITQVGVRLHYDGKKYEAYGESDTEIRTVMLEVVEGSIPFQKMTVSSALKKAIEQCVSQMP